MALPSRQWLALLVPLFGIAGWMLARTIRSLLQTTRGAVVATVPAAADQVVILAEPGRYVLMVEGRQFTRDFARAEFELTDSSGTRIPLHLVVVRTAVKSFSRVRLALREFEIGVPGSYTIHATGLPADQDSGNRLIVSRPVGGQIVLHVLGIVVSGILLIGSLVGSIILLVGQRPTPP